LRKGEDSKTDFIDVRLNKIRFSSPISTHSIWNAVLENRTKDGFVLLRTAIDMRLPKLGGRGFRL
jgi:hypothetical protein